MGTMHNLFLIAELPSQVLGTSFWASIATWFSPYKSLWDVAFPVEWNAYITGS